MLRKISNTHNPVLERTAPWLQILWRDLSFMCATNHGQTQLESKGCKGSKYIIGRSTVLMLTWREEWERLSSGNQLYRMIIFTSCLSFSFHDFHIPVWHILFCSNFRSTYRENKQIVQHTTHEGNLFSVKYSNHFRFRLDSAISNKETICDGFAISLSIVKKLIHKITNFTSYP